MADIYLKKVDASSRSEWTSGNSYVIGDRVYLASATMQDTYWNDGASTFATWRTFVCLADNSSTTSPEDDSTNWIEAGTSKEYPYHCIGGDLTASSTNSEIYLEEESTRWSTQSLGGATFYHLRRGESQFSLGKLIIVSDTPNPVFIVNKDVAIIGFSIEPDSSTERFSIVCMNGGKLGSHVSHNIHDSQYAKIDKCNIYYSGTNGYMLGIIYDNLSKIEFADCLFSEQASEAGYADLSAPGITLGLRNFLGFRSCSFFFPSVDLTNDFIWDSQSHSTGVESFIDSCSFLFKSYKSTNFLRSFRSGISIKDNIFYFSGSDGQEIRVINSSHNNFECKNNVLYIGDNSATFNYINAGEDYSEKLKNINPKFVSTDSPKGMQLRPSSPLIGGLSNQGKQSEIENQYPQGKWFDSNAAAGGDGAWDTPYNNYGEAINSFTGDEAVILIKEGQHPLQPGHWNGSNFNTNNDLSKLYSNGIKFIGMGAGSIFTTESITSYGAFNVYAANNVNNKNQTFLFKDFDILLNNTSFINRGMICAHRSEYINVNASQALNLGAINGNLFDYCVSNDVGEYLKMSGCTINISMSTNAQSTSFLVGHGLGLKQFSNCTFADLNRTTSQTAAGSPSSFIHPLFGSYQSSYIKDCIFYSKTPNTTHFGTSANTPSSQGATNLEVKNCAVFSTQGSASIGSNFGDSIKVLDPKFIATEPHDFDLRLRPSSALIGGITKHPSASTSIWYVNLIDGDDTNDGKTPDTAMLTISAAHAASIHLDTIFIVNENISVSSDLDFPGGRKYESLTKCTIDFNDNYSSSISAAAGLDTYIKGFDFIKMRGDYSLLSISSDVNSLFVIESCKFEGILTHSQSAPIGGNGISSRNARQGSMIKGCSFDIGWSTQTSGGSTSCGFIAVDRTDIVACTFWVKDSTPLGSTNLYLVGTGGQGAHSHGPPIGPIEVKNCIVHGNDRMHYGMSTSGNGGNLGFTSNARVSVNSANYVIHNCCLYGINGTPMEIDNSISNNRYNIGSVANDRSIPLEWIENIFTEDPKLVDPGGGNFALKADSPLIGQGK